MTEFRYVERRPVKSPPDSPGLWANLRSGSLWIVVRYDGELVASPVEFLEGKADMGNWMSTHSLCDTYKKCTEVTYK